MIARVVVNNSSSNVDYCFDYLIDPVFENLIKIGSRVKVPFGQANRLYVGYVIDLIDDYKADFDFKNVEEVIDCEPLISKNCFKLAYFIKTKYICPLSRILNIMIPDGLHQKLKKFLVVDNIQNLPANLVDAFKSERILFSKELLKKFPALNKQILNGKIRQEYELEQNAKPQNTRMYYIDQSFIKESESSLKPDEIEFINKMHSNMLSIQEMQARFEITYSKISKLRKLGILKFKDIEDDYKTKMPFKISKKAIADINSAEDVVLEIKRKLNKPVYYISKSKNETFNVFKALINDTIKQNKKIIFVCPDILSTYMYYANIIQDIDVEVGLINSHQVDNKNILNYFQIRDNNIRVVITTFVGALYDYLDEAMYVLIDSESDGYFNVQSPRIDLKDVLIEKVALTGGKIILHTYTSNIVDYMFGLKSVYNIVDTRIDCPQKNVEIVDLKKSHNLISDRILKEIINAKNEGLSTVLIINQKGYSSFVSCRTCGEVAICSKCNIRLSYIASKGELICPSCGKKISFHNRCPMCNSDKILFLGFGQEKVFEELESHHLNLKMLYLNNSNYQKYVENVDRISNHDVDVIISTDIYERSIDNSYVKNVVIVNFDTALKTPNYDSSQNAYNMLVHANELINYKLGGKIYIQTYQLNNYVLESFITDNYRLFFREEARLRNILKVEPFYHVNRILVKGKYNAIFKVSQNIKDTLYSLDKRIIIIGPTYNRKEQAVQIIIKHQIDDISEYYFKIYEIYQQSDVLIIFDLVPKYI